MRGVPGHPILHEPPLRAVRTFYVNVALKGSPELVAVNWLPMELCLAQWVGKTIPSRFHEGLLRRPETREGLVLSVKAGTVLFHILPLFPSEVVLEDIVEVYRFPVSSFSAQLCYVNASDDVRFAGTHNPFAFVGAVHIPIGSLVFRRQRLGQEGLLTLGPLDFDVFEVCHVQRRCTRLTHQQSRDKSPLLILQELESHDGFSVCLFLD
mmetsp:Transcript_101237/g.241429  ORF Transcript_101237/g.241429 Transcript_101237/m.241429 type:complete len:209 (-) Transcript_101237:547-1173(-)